MYDSPSSPVEDFRPGQPPGHSNLEGAHVPRISANGLIYLAIPGALSLASAVLALGIGLIRSARTK